MGILKAAAQNQHIIIPGQSVFPSLTDAQVENIFSLALGSLPSPEFAQLYKITFGTNGSYDSAIGRCRIEAVEKIIGSSIRVSFNQALGDHSQLSGRSAPNAHPVGAIQGTISGAVIYNDNGPLSEDARLIWDELTGTMYIQGSLGTYALPVQNIKVENLAVSGSMIFNPTGPEPTSINDAGTEGEIRYANNFWYLKVGGFWRRGSLSLF